MEINKTLGLIYASFSKFSFLPSSMDQNISKSLFQSYLQDNSTIDAKAIEIFLDVIFDENEESQESIPRNVFNAKYDNLLKLIEEDNEDDQEREPKPNNNPHQLETPTKGNQIVSFGSPILVQEFSAKNENDTSMEAVELFKDIKFGEEKLKCSNNNYNSIVRPSNNFNFNGVNGKSIFNSSPRLDLNNNKPASTQSPREKQNQLISANNHPKIPKLSIDFNIQNYKKANNMKFINPHRMYNSNTPHKSYTIQQKIQDIYFQIHKSNDLNSTPVKQPLNKNYYTNNNNPGVMNSNHINNENFFSNVYRPVNPSSSVKSMNWKMNQFYLKDKRNDLYHNYTRSHTKAVLNQKLEGLNKMLNSRSLGLNGEKILSPDDFVTLEEKMNQFTLIKKSTGQSKLALKRELSLPESNKEMNDNVPVKDSSGFEQELN